MTSLITELIGRLKRLCFLIKMRLEECLMNKGMIAICRLSTILGRRLKKCGGITLISTLWIGLLWMKVACPLSEERQRVARKILNWQISKLRTSVSHIPKTNFPKSHSLNSQDPETPQITLKPMLEDLNMVII